MKTINIPKRWEDVSWSRFVALKEIDSKAYASDFSKSVAIVAQLCGVTEGELVTLPTKELAAIIESVRPLLSSQITPVPQSSFTFNGTNYQFKMDVTAQFMRIEEALSVSELMKANGKPFDPKPFILAAVFVPVKQDKPKPKGWFATTAKAVEALTITVEQKFNDLYQATVGRNVIAELDGYDERVEIIKQLDCVTVHALDFFLSIVISDSPMATKTQSLRAAAKIKIAQTRKTIQEIRSSKLRTPLANSGAVRLSMSLAEARLKYLDFMLTK